MNSQALPNTLTHPQNPKCIKQVVVVIITYVVSHASSSVNTATSWRSKLRDINKTYKNSEVDSPKGFHKGSELLQGFSECEKIAQQLTSICDESTMFM